jgi:hypothetical protein
MSAKLGRRVLLQSAALGSVAAALQQIDFLHGLPRVSAEDARPDPKSVQFSDDIEPLVRLIEQTPREQLLEKVADHIRKGTSYREVVAALLLAGVRNVQPRPSVGFKFHAVLVVNSAHLASLASPDDQRWLPIFWALDYFKDSQARDEREGNWTMAPVDEAKVPAAHKARAMFVEAMEKWDEEQADVAAAALARSASSDELFDLFSRYGSRDYRSIGHKAIYVANAWRTLDMIGWQYAEPVLRSLSYAMLAHEGDKDPATNDYKADRPYRDNQARIKQIRDEWKDGKLDEAATKELIGTLYAGSSDDVCEQVVEMLNRGVAVQSIWDALLVGSGELLMRQPGIVGLHTLTTSNALHYAFQTASNDETRRLLLLQNAAFLPMFRESMTGRGSVADVKLTELMPDEANNSQDDPLDNIFNAISTDRMAAARQTLAYATEHPAPDDFMQRARVLVFLKGRDSHDYKFSSAVLEDYLHVSAPWRSRYLAASVFNLRGSDGRDNPVVERTKKALA